MNCQKCATQIDDTTSVCPTCGEEINNSLNDSCSDSNSIAQSENGNEAEALHEPKSASPKNPTQKKRAVTKTDIDHSLHGRINECTKAEGLVPLLQKQVLQRIVSCYLKYTAGMDSDSLQKSLTDNLDKVTNKKRISESLDKFDSIREKRILKDIILLEVIAQQETYKIETNELHEEVERIENQILENSKNIDLKQYANNDSSRFRDFDVYSTVLEVAWRNDDNISSDEESLLSELRKKLSISINDHRFIEVKLGKFPKHHNKIHSREEVDKFRVELQKEGLLWLVKEKGVEYNIVPIEIMEAIRHTSKLELQTINYRRLLNAKTISKNDLVNVLKKEGLATAGSKDEQIQNILQSNITPSQFLSSLGIDSLKNMCVSIGIKSSGTKDEKIERLIAFFDDLSFEKTIDTDEREKYYHVFELLAARKYNDLRAMGIISKQEEVEHYFEKATDYLFEKKFFVTIEKGLYGNVPDGIIYLKNKKAVLWDNKSSETEVHLKDHLEGQFNQYIRKEQNKGNDLFFFMVIGPCFSEDSSRLARIYKTDTDQDVCLVEATVLKQIADIWSSKNPDKEFPLGVFNKAGLVTFDETLDLLREKM